MPAASSPVAEPWALRSRPVCRLATAPEERERHFAIRRAVFCVEQGMFGGADRVQRVRRVVAGIAVVGAEGAVVGGTVRLYPLGADGLWQGDRLAVLPLFRRTSLGGALVRFAVRTAGARGGSRMVAMIQRPNVPFFLSLGWSLDGPVAEFHGREHQPMAIALSAAPDG